MNHFRFSTRCIYLSLFNTRTAVPPQPGLGMDLAWSGSVTCGYKRVLRFKPSTEYINVQNKIITPRHAKSRLFVFPGLWRIQIYA